MVLLYFHIKTYQPRKKNIEITPSITKIGKGVRIIFLSYSLSNIVVEHIWVPLNLKVVLYILIFIISSNKTKIVWGIPILIFCTVFTDSMLSYNSLKFIFYYHIQINILCI